MGKIKFGIFLPFYLLQAKGIQPTQRFSFIRNIVLESEKQGYDSIWLDDHLMYNYWPILESWTTLSALASLTSKVRLGTMVSCNANRSPSLLAKMAATFDVISDGRLEFGIGAGVQENEHLAYGLGFPNHAVRVERLGEALEVIKRMWTEEKTTYQGKYYAIKDAVCEPKPLQKPWPPITVGGSGELLMKKATAPFADRFDWGLLPSIEMYKRKLMILEKQCEVIGRSFKEIEKSCWPSGQVLIAKNERELIEKTSQLKPSNVSLEDFKKTSLVGTPDECVQQLQVYVDLGVTYFMLFFADLPKLDGLKQFSEGVINKIG